MWFFVILVQFFTGCSAMLANARMTYAFARDEALPLSRYIDSLKTSTRVHADTIFIIASGVKSTNSPRHL